MSLLKSRTLNKRLHGWVLKLLDFDFEVLYKPGKDHLDADCLSRQAWDSNEGGPLTNHGSVIKGTAEQSRTTSISVGGDVGIRPT